MSQSGINPLLQQQYDFILQKHKFRIDSSTPFGKSLGPDFMLMTDAGSGIMFSSDGASFMMTSLYSVETVGVNYRPDPDSSAKSAKHIKAYNGDIVLEANNGDIVLKGLNIRLHARDAFGGEIIIDSSKFIQMNAPISTIQGDNFTVSAANSVNLGGGSASVIGQFANEQTTGTDEIKASFFGKILSAIKRFKDFFNTICSV